MNKKNKLTNEQIKEIKEELENNTIQITPTLFNERKWSDSGYLYKIELNKSDQQKCDLSDKPIESGKPVIVKPYENFFKPYTYTFLIENAIRTVDFDWENFISRLRISMHENMEVKKKIGEKLNRIYELFPSENLQNLLATVESEKQIAFNVYGLERQKIKKELLCYDVYFEKIICEAEQKEMENLLNGFSCFWSDGIHLCIESGTKKTTTLDFKEEILNILKTIKQPIIAAHFCKAGDYRLSKANVCLKNNLKPFPFLFINHNEFKQNYWELFIKFKNSIPQKLTNSKELSIFKSNWMNERITFSADASWLRTSGGNWDGVGQKADEELYSLNDQYPLVTVILNDLTIISTSDVWADWSSQYITAGLTDEFNAVKEYLRHEREKMVQKFDIEKAYKYAKDCYNHAEEMGDAWAALEGLIEIANKIPFELRNDERVIQINAWMAEITKILDEYSR